jgi:modification methylase
MTKHVLVENDCRNLSFIPDESVNLILTHPPNFGSLANAQAVGRFSAILDYDEYLKELDVVWAECSRVLAPGGHLACVASPVARCEEDLPLTADVYARTRRLGLEMTHSIRWLGADRAELDDVHFYGASNQPCGELLCDSQDILVMRKPGERLASAETQVSSRMAADYFATCSSSVWLIPAVRDPRYPESFPVELAERVIRMFSYAGDTVLDPFAGMGTTSAAAIAWGRNSIAVEIQQRFFDSMADRMAGAQWPDGEIVVTRGPLAAEDLAPPAAMPVV